MQPIINSVSNTTKNDTTTVFLKRHLSQSSDTLDIEKVGKYFYIFQDLRKIVYFSFIHIKRNLFAYLSILYLFVNDQKIICDYWNIQIVYFNMKIACSVKSLWEKEIFREIFCHKFFYVWSIKHKSQTITKLIICQYNCRKIFSPPSGSFNRPHARRVNFTVIRKIFVCGDKL